MYRKVLVRIHKGTILSMMGHHVLHVFVQALDYPKHFLHFNVDLCLHILVVDIVLFSFLINLFFFHFKEWCFLLFDISRHKYHIRDISGFISKRLHVVIRFVLFRLLTLFQCCMIFLAHISGIDICMVISAWIWVFQLWILWINIYT